MLCLVITIKCPIILFRYVYRFVCDLQGLLGYSPEEIHSMVAHQDSAAAGGGTSSSSAAANNGSGQQQQQAPSPVKQENE
jgi:hypothetical protein